jgi:hypothetical protein
MLQTSKQVSIRLWDQQDETPRLSTDIHPSDIETGLRDPCPELIVCCDIERKEDNGQCELMASRRVDTLDRSGPTLTGSFSCPVTVLGIRDRSDLRQDTEQRCRDAV